MSATLDWFFEDIPVRGSVEWWEGLSVDARTRKNNVRGFTRQLTTPGFPFQPTGGVLRVFIVAEPGAAHSYAIRVVGEDMRELVVEAPFNSELATGEYQEWIDFDPQVLFEGPGVYAIELSVDGQPVWRHAFLVRQNGSRM